jgi:O-antigen ligase
VILLIIYWYSEDEPFWLAFFLVISDGFLGFFGLYIATLSPFPGMPAIEIAQFYIILSVIKARYKNQNFVLFFKNILNLMGIYLIFLILLGFALGIDNNINEYFRIVKITLPFLLFYSLPKLFIRSDDFQRFFALIFPITLLAFFSQIFEIINSRPLTSFLGVGEIIEKNLADDEPIRSFYNSGIVFMTLFGALFYSSRKDHKFNYFYLILLTVIACSMAFLSATRGWILGFGIIVILYMIFNVSLKTGRVLNLIILGIAFFFIVVEIPTVNHQVMNAYNRFNTVEKIAEGDVSASETEIRSTLRGPRVINKWKESPIIGFGFSNEFRIYYDPHVGNQNILLHSGIIGFVLMLIFFITFIFKMINARIISNDKSLLIFVFVFMGWFLIHSTSGQAFAYMILPVNIIPQAVFFCYGAFCVAKAEKSVINRNDIR